MLYNRDFLYLFTLVLSHSQLNPFEVRLLQPTTFNPLALFQRNLCPTSSKHLATFPCLLRPHAAHTSHSAGHRHQKSVSVITFPCPYMSVSAARTSTTQPMHGHTHHTGGKKHSHYSCQSSFCKVPDNLLLPT